jgi:DNA polymerase-3 subunit gamma/tau
MEVPDSVRKLYYEQAQATQSSLLLTWLNMASLCDINYKSSKNQRLLVELTLMKMANVHAVLQLDTLSQSSDEGLKKKVVSQV